MQIQGADNLPHSYEQRSRQIAWTVLLLAFVTFCTISAILVYSGYRYVTTATIGLPARLLADVPVGVTYQTRGSTAFLTVDNSGGGSQLAEGYRVRVAAPSATGYGKVASLELADGSSLDIRAGTDVTLDTYRRTRWSERAQYIKIVQTSGYVRYNLRPDKVFETTAFVVELGNGVSVDLAPKGSYSVKVRPPQRTLLLSGSAAPRVVPDAQIEVAVRGQGTAVVHGRERSATIGAGQLVVVRSGVVQLPVPATWELMRDTRFSEFSQDEYNNTTLRNPPPTIVRADTWEVRGQATGAVERKEDQGQFGIVRECLEPQPYEGCPMINTARFIRTDGQTQGFITSIVQDLGDPVPPPGGPQVRSSEDDAPRRQGVDVSEYTRLQLSADLRLLNQSLDKGGQAGSECPLLVRIFYKDTAPADTPQEQTFCFWYKDGPNGTLTPDAPGYFASQQVEQYEWTHFSVDLRDERFIPRARYLQRVQIEARGHDYNVEITNVSLIATQ
jgi:mannose-6-phosphate isomerase-like protein (cupin superfamily)